MSEESTELDLERLEIELKEELATWRSFLDWKNTGKPIDGEVQYILTYRPEERVSALLSEVRRLREENQGLRKDDRKTMKAVARARKQNRQLIANLKELRKEVAGLRKELNKYAQRDHDQYAPDDLFFPPYEVEEE